VQTICDAQDGRGGTWNADDVIVFAPAPFSGLSKVSATGGTPVAVTKVEGQGRTDRLPWFLPDGKHLLYFSGSQTSDTEKGSAINVLDHPDFSDVGTMRGLLKAFEDKARLVDLLTRMAEERGVQVLIGGENPVEEMRECSLITSTYMYRGQVLGVLGVVGPRRMAYGDVISIVDETARLVSDSLSRVQRELYLPS
jgi:hypothetical protein